MDLSTERTQDRLDVREAGHGWLHVHWNVSSKTLARAASAMGRDGHHRAPVLRLHRVQHDESGPRSKEHLQDIVVPDEALEWFLNVPPHRDAWIVEVGFLFGKGRFFSLLHSIPVVLSTRRDQPEEPQRDRQSELSGALETGGPPPLKVKGTFVLSGSTRPRARLSIDDEDVPVDPHTGTFDWSRAVHNGRAVFPITVSEHGKAQRGLLAVEVNLHLLEPEPDVPS